MPSYHSWGPTAQHSRLPPTPPEYQTAYLTPMSTVSDNSYYSSQGFHGRHASSRDYSERYHQLPAYSAQQSLSGHAHPRMKHLASAQDYHLQGYPTQLVPQYQYAAAAAPILPPIRVTDSLDQFGGHFAQEPKPKDEKPTGGVAQHLDYEMELMASFVAEMSQKMYDLFASNIHVADIDMIHSVAPGTAPTSQFRKYVSQILSSTRLPSSTIMLGLFYLASRMKLISERGQDVSSSGTVYRMLTTCLLLGSKFLDDNTFQNRSWAEVSSIPVQELNMMELDWLEGFSWEIHRLMYKDDEGFFTWIDHWKAYELKAKTAKVKELQKLSPIETNLHRSHSVQHQPLMSPEGPIPPQYQQGPQYDTQWVRPYISEYSPPSAPHSGPATPDYYSGTWSYAQTPSSYSRQSWNASGSAYAVQQAQLPSYRHTPSYPPFSYAHSSWAGHGPNCGCTLCGKHPEYYFSHSGYGMQTVVG